MYHGGSYTQGEFKGDVWFTSSKDDAKYYAKQNHGIVTKAYLIVKDPIYSGHIKHLNISLTDEIINSITKRHITNSVISKRGIIEYIEPNSAILIAKDTGKDGVISLDDGEILDVVVFSNNQIIKPNSKFPI